MLKRFAGMAILFFVLVKSALSQPNPLDALLSEPALRGAWVGVLVQTVDEPPRTLFSHNEDRYFMPASNAKLFVTAIALEKLGPDFTFITPLLTNGKRIGETLEGNLYLKGTGDPSLSRDRLRELAKAIAAKEIKFVKGDVIVDVNAFADNRWGNGWAWDYLHYGYAAEVWALALDRNAVTLQIAPAPQEGVPAQITVSPTTDWLLLDNRVLTVKNDTASLRVWREAWERVVHLWGRLPVGSPPQTFRLSVPSIPHYIGQTFWELLREAGITVSGHAKTGLTPENAVVLATTSSPPLRELVWWLNKVSDNLYAEMLLRAVALKERRQGSFADAREILQQQLTEWGIEPTAVQLADGSGLSRLNLVTPRALVRLLQVARTRSWFVAFRNSLPIGGKDGTLGNRFRNTPAEGCVFAKTGFISGVMALSGYLQRIDGRELVFTVLVNHFTAPAGQVQAAVDRFIVALTQFPLISPDASN